jgi:hypothetical protein
MSATEWKALLAKASQDDAEAEYRIAGVYSDGCKDRHGKIVVHISPRMAVKWNRRSAEHGSADAQGALGYLLSEGIGVKRDSREALLWMRRAFLNGETFAAPNNIAITYRQIGNLRQAVRWFNKCADLGDDDALVQLGVHYYWGKGVRTDYAAAVRCFRRAIKGKNISEWVRADAFFYLGIAYLEGKGVRRSLRLAEKCLERANKDNDHAAAERLLKKMLKLTGRRQ